MRREQCRKHCLKQNRFLLLLFSAILSWASSLAAAASANASQSNLFSQRHPHRGDDELDANGDPVNGNGNEQGSICVRALRWVGECLFGCVLSLYRYIRSAPLDFLGAGGNALSTSGIECFLNHIERYMRVNHCQPKALFVVQ